MNTSIKRLSSRLKRVEHKCDRILREIQALRATMTRSAEIDDVIEHLHSTAWEMRQQSIRERQAIRRYINR